MAGHTRQEDVLKRKNFESQEGQSLILIALMMVALIGMLGLALDGGRAFASRRASQNAADSAAFGAVRLLATKSMTATEPAIWDTITKFAKANDVVTTTDILAYFIDSSAKNICRIPNCGGIPANATGVRVTTTLQLQPYFIDVLIGKQKIPIPAAAAAQSGPPVLASDLMPMAVRFPCPYPPDPNDTTCNVHYDNPPVALFGDKTSPGGFQWTSYDCGTSAQDLAGYLGLSKPSGQVMADALDTYYNPSHPTDYNNMPPPSPWVCSSPGVDETARKVLDCWIEPNGNGCWPPPTRYPGNRLWTVPVFDQTNGQTGSGTMYHTVMFAEFELLGYWFKPGQYNYVGKDQGQSLPSQLQQCINQNVKCVMGVFKQQVTDLEMSPGKCNTNGVQICAIGMSQ
jgi:hypothetical protein